MRRRGEVRDLVFLEAMTEVSLVLEGEPRLPVARCEVESLGNMVHSYRLQFAPT